MTCVINKKVYQIEESPIYMSLLRGKVKNLQSFCFLFKGKCVLSESLLFILGYFHMKTNKKSYSITNY